MAAPKVFTGGRAIVKIAKPRSAEVVVGIFDSFSYGVTFDAQPVYTLGAYSPREIEYTAQEPINCSASGWRVIGHGPHVQALFPKLEDLLQHEYLNITVTDRVTKAVIANIKGVRPTSYSHPIASRQLTQMSISFMALLVTDESGGNSGSEGDLPATNLPI